MSSEANQRMTRLAQSDIRAMTQACARIKGINMAQGVCDTPVPSVVAQGAERAIVQGINTYTRYDGLVELRTSDRSETCRLQRPLRGSRNGDHGERRRDRFFPLRLFGTAQSGR